MSKASDVAYKLCNGTKLTIQEFSIAIEKGMLTGPKPQTQEELAESYLYWVAGYYENSKHRGYLCSSHPTKWIRDLPHGGKEFCSGGIHMDEVNPKALTKENLKFLRHHFGKDKVKEITGS